MNRKVDWFFKTATPKKDIFQLFDLKVGGRWSLTQHAPDRNYNTEWLEKELTKMQ